MNYPLNNFATNALLIPSKQKRLTKLARPRHVLAQGNTQPPWQVVVVLWLDKKGSGPPPPG